MTVAGRRRPAPVAGGRAVAGKRARQSALLELVRTRPVRTQEELVSGLRARHFDVTQATVSRDIRELGLLRTRGSGGMRYVMPAAEVDEGAALRRLANALHQHSLGMEFVDLLGLVHAQPGSASLLAAAIDGARFDELAGTVAGDDTVLLVARSRPAAQRLLLRLRAISEDGR